MYIPEYPYSIRLNGRLTVLDRPLVMGILNVTPDSFYAGSRSTASAEAVERAGRMFAQGADIVDVGACSTRPGSEPVSEQEEADRLFPVLEVLCRAFPQACFSVDTFRSRLAATAVERYGAAMINDVSGGADPHMFETVARLQVPYVLTDNPAEGEAGDSVSVIRRLASSMMKLRELGVNDIVADPGFGFGKTLEENYALLKRLSDLNLALQLPLMVGISRKSMIYNLLDTTPDHALNGTTALNMVALEKGACLLRVHDVSQAVECVRIHDQLK